MQNNSYNSYVENHIVMKEVVIRETDIVSAANEGMDSFLSLLVKSIKDSVCVELNAENKV